MRVSTLEEVAGKEFGAFRGVQLSQREYPITILDRSFDGCPSTLGFIDYQLNSLPGKHVHCKTRTIFLPAIPCLRPSSRPVNKPYCRQTVEGTFFGVERLCLAVEEAWNLAYCEQPNHGSIKRKWISKKKSFSAKKGSCNNARLKKKKITLKHWVHLSLCITTSF